MPGPASGAGQLRGAAPLRAGTVPERFKALVSDGLSSVAHTGSIAAMHRCGWAARGSELELAYHDREWGVPSRDDRHLFEMLILEGAQAGLSWATILNKRTAYQAAYADFDAARVARFTTRDRAQLLANAGIVRNRLKIDASIANARAVLAVQAEYGSFAAFLWQFVGGTPIQGRRSSMKDIPAETAESRAMSTELKRRGFRFVGPTICYAFMQAVGMANDHERACFRYPALR